MRDPDAANAVRQARQLLDQHATFPTCSIAISPPVLRALVVALEQVAAQRELSRAAFQENMRRGQEEGEAIRRSYDHPG